LTQVLPVRTQVLRVQQNHYINGDEQINEVCDEGKRPDNQDDPLTEGQTPHAEESVQNDGQRETRPRVKIKKGSR